MDTVLSRSASSKTLANTKIAIVPSIAVVSPSTPQTSDGSNAGDPTAATLYKVRRAPRNSGAKTKSQRSRCHCDNLQAAKCWAFTNLIFSVLDWIFSMCELLVYTVYTTPYENKFTNPFAPETVGAASEDKYIHWLFFLTSVSLHGDCFESLIEVAITFSSELVYLISSFLFAFATVLEREENRASRCLAQWFIFSVWIPPLALIPRFVLNVVSNCGTRYTAKLFPNANENAPRIAFWIVNLLHIFCMILWLINGRLVALNFLKFKKEEELQKSSLRKVNSGGSSDNITLAPSGIPMGYAQGAGDKVLQRNRLGGILLPPTVSMV